MKKIYHFAKTILSLFIVLVFLFLGTANLTAQISVGSEPMSILLGLSTSFEQVNMPPVDTKKLLEEDAAIANVPDLPLRYAKVLDVNYSPDNSGTWETLSDGSRIWRLGIKSTDAKSINLFFNEFYMPKGATFFVYNLSKTMILGAFTELNNSESRQFATALTSGNYTVVEYYEPVYSANMGRINIAQVVHAYKDIMGFNSPLELACNININCPIGAPWVDQKRSVARMNFNQGGSGFLCTGSLINNTLNNRTPYFLTAQHCESDNWNTLVTTFNFESPTCAGTASGPSQTLSGAVNKAENFDTDFRLLQMNNSPTAAMNAYFNGWDRSGAGPVNEVAVHHPGGAIKKISIDNNPAASVTGFGGRLPNGFWQVTWDEGMTEGGSSGCPLYDQNKRVVGQNLGGTPSQCENPQAVQKVFGKFSESWAHGGLPTNQLKDWLDPNNSSVSTLDGINDLTGIAPVSNFTSNLQNLPIGGGTVDFYDLTSNDPVSWTWSFPGGTPSTSTQRNPTGISYTATGAYTVTLTTTNAFGSNMKTIVNYVRVAGVPMSAFVLKTPPTGSTVFAYPPDPVPVQFTWGTANPNPLVTYNFRIRKLGPGTDVFLPSDNNGQDTVISLRQSYLDSLAVMFGTTGDSVQCTWRVSAMNGLDTLTTTSFLVKIRRLSVGISQISSTVPENYNLYDNYPNPFNPKTVIKFDISKTQIVKLTVYNLLGEEINTLVNENLTPGSYSVDFNAGNISSGMYFYRIETPEFSQTKRMVLVK